MLTEDIFSKWKFMELEHVADAKIISLCLSQDVDLWKWCDTVLTEAAFHQDEGAKT